jgi:cysteine-rich repeat protein
MTNHSAASGLGARVPIFVLVVLASACGEPSRPFDDAGPDADTGGDADADADAGGDADADADAGGDADADAGGDADADAGGDADGGDCGNSIVDDGEDCDDGNLSDDDECLTTCRWACGDGLVNAVELCDTAIADGEAGACPDACVDLDPCTADTLLGGGCRAECVFDAVEDCRDADGCCPDGCDSFLDDDCAAECGNGAVELGETCDPPGSCPTACADGDGCTDDVLEGSAANCTAHCTYPAVVACRAGDGCCPAGCTAATDGDCSAECGDGEIQAGETCDPPDTCPVSCDDGDPCTGDVMTGSAANCNVACSHPPVEACAGGDGCCPDACHALNDDDCDPECGNGVVEPGEECDDGDIEDGDGCDSSCQSEPTAYLVTDLDLMDPHVFVTVFWCMDVTNPGWPLPAGSSVNEQLQASITADGDGDGLLDLSFLLVFRPEDRSVPHTGPMDFAVGECTAPLDLATTCGLDPSETPEAADFTNGDTGRCLAPFPATTGSYTPAIATPGPLCFSSTGFTMTIDLGGIPIALESVQVGATYRDAAARDQLVNGLLRGFMSEADAEATIIPDDVDIVGGMALSALLPGGAGCCSRRDDRDTLPDGTTGWWFYFNFTATQVTYTGP